MTNPLTPRQEIWRGLLFGQRAMLNDLAAELKRDFGLTVPAFEALRALSEAPRQTLKATRLAQSLVYSSGSASHLISRLHDAGLVDRTPSTADARVVEVSLTSQGTDLINRATAAHRRSIAREFEPLIGDADIAPLLAFARRLAAHESTYFAPPN
jgi:DNA-binding MarR family transcriptional regulator